MKIFYYITFLIVLFSCKKENVIPNNNVPYYGEIPTLLIENYVNRLYIDLLGREPLDEEMIFEVQYLRDNNVSTESREEIIYKIQNDTSFIEGDSSYKKAYYHRMYDLIKVRLIEGASNGYIKYINNNVWQDYLNDSLAGNMIDANKKLLEFSKLNDVINSENEYMKGNISINELHRRMTYNVIYDDINMNTFNYINAIFDNLIFRYPTSYEFNNCQSMIDDNSTELLMGESGNNKYELGLIICNSNEFTEGLINWSYITYLGRESSIIERDHLMKIFITDNDYQKIQRIILSSDEYAHF
ncbi:MAG: hypothetical protein CMP51_04630 [Flavobacteriales bacterium]|nr:hypothetical protein [Flavobacteriales bacterium]